MIPLIEINHVAASYRVAAETKVIDDVELKLRELFM